MRRRRIFFAVLVATAIALPVAAQGLTTDAAIDTAVQIDNSSPWWAYAVPVAISLGGAAISIVVPLMNARNQHSQTMTKLRMEYSDELRDEMKEWLKEELAQKEAEIQQLRQRCNQLEEKLASFEAASTDLKQRYTALRARYARLLQEYNQTKAMLDGYELASR